MVILCNGLPRYISDNLLWRIAHTKTGTAFLSAHIERADDVLISRLLLFLTH